MSLVQLAKICVILGFALIVIGGFLYLLSRTGSQLWNLPGDFRFQRGPFTCVFALGTSLVLSILFTIVLNLILRLLHR